MSASPGENVCVVKYIDIRSMQADDPVYNIDKFVKGEKTIEHGTYEDLHDKVFSNSPQTYRCIEPLALHHEVLWSNGIVFVNGVDKRGYVGRDQLHHAIEEQEYNILWNGVDTHKPLPIFVDVEKEVDTVFTDEFTLCV